VGNIIVTHRLDLKMKMH